MTEPNRPPLLQLFNRLREAGLLLGIEEYKLLLSALEDGFGAPDLDSLSSLCKTLWIKSNDDLRLFERIFADVMRTKKKSTFPGDNPLAGEQAQKTHSSTGPLSQEASSQAGSSSESLSDAEQQTIQAVLHKAPEEDLLYKRFVRSDEYFPVTRRQMKQSWRHLRHPVRQGPPIELDIDKTIDEIGHLGFLFKPVFQPRYVNRAEILLLIDQHGSMVPFHILSARLAETALRGGRLTNIGVYYFRNYPVERLYRTSSLWESVLITEVLEGLHHEHSGVLIFSDAGAARGHFSRQRYIGTKRFLDQLSEHVRYQAWLNPMPAERWIDTTAQSIQQFIPMFDISQRGLEQAINVLRGRSTV